MKNIRFFVAMFIAVSVSAGSWAIELSDIANTVKSVGGKAGLPTGNSSASAPIDDALKIGTALFKAVDNDLGPVEEYFLGREVSARLLGAYGQPLPQEDKISQYVTSVGTTLALGSRAPYLYHPYTFVVLQANEMNAFAAPGGIIFVTTGMLKFLKSEDELAGVLGHEIAHVELRHGVKAVSQEGKLDFLKTTKDVALKQVDTGSSAGNQVLDQISGPIADSVMGGLRNGYSVELEQEADLRSLEICAGVGYAPKAFVDVLARFKQTTSSYGGAKYPQNREAAAAARVNQIPGASGLTVGAERTERFNKTMNG